MKLLFFFLSCFMLNMNFSHAAPRMYLKKTYSLFSPTGQYHLTCRFFSHKVEITESTGTASSIRFEPTAYSGVYLRGLIKLASYNPLKSSPYNICDAGSANVRAYKQNGDWFTLIRFEDCSPTPMVYRNGVASLHLRNIVEQYCQTSMPD